LLNLKGMFDIILKYHAIRILIFITNIQKFILIMQTYSFLSSNGIYQFYHGCGTHSDIIRHPDSSAGSSQPKLDALQVSAALAITH